jgi:hypothetical protein
MSRSSLKRAHRPLVTVAALALLASCRPPPLPRRGSRPVVRLGGRAINAEADARGSAIVRTPDGGVVIAGEGFGASSDMFIVRKLTASGQPAPGFGGADGTAAIRVGEDANVVGVALHGDSSIVIGGDAKNEVDKRGLVAARMNGTSGAPDPSFGLHNGRASASRRSCR